MPGRVWGYPLEYGWWTQQYEHLCNRLQMWQQFASAELQSNQIRVAACAEDPRGM